MSDVTAIVDSLGIDSNNAPAPGNVGGHVYTNDNNAFHWNAVFALSDSSARINELIEAAIVAVLVGAGYTFGPSDKITIFGRAESLR